MPVVPFRPPLSAPRIDPDVLRVQGKIARLFTLLPQSALLIESLIDDMIDVVENEGGR